MNPRLEPVLQHMKSPSDHLSFKIEGSRKSLKMPNHDHPEQPFYIQGMGQTSRKRKTLKHNDAFAVFDSHGDIGAVGGGPDGFFDSDTRFLSRFEVLINGMQPLLLGSNVRDDNLHMYVDLTNPDITENETIVLPKDTIHISRAIFLRDGVMYVRLALENHSEKRNELALSIDFENDFADIFEVRGSRRKKRGHSRKRILGTGNVILSYDGLDGIRRDTSIFFEPAPAQLSDARAVYAVRLQPHERTNIFISASSRGPATASTAPFFKALRAADRDHKRATRDVASIETSSAPVNETLCRSMADFYMLVSTTAQGPYPYAGIPWYSTTFGRDGLIAAMQMLWLDPNIARGVLRRLAALQATQTDASKDSQPGKILHEMRGGEMASLNEVPFGLYYGSVDSTPLFVMLMGQYVERTGDLDLLSELWGNVERALKWIDTYGDLDDDGFVEYKRAVETGLSNQGWKDSFDSIFHADGKLASGAIALVEVQAYIYAAKLHASNCARKLGHEARSAQLRAESNHLRQRFQRAFWLDEIGCYALALDGNKSPCAVRSSNAYHALYCGIASAEKVDILVKTLSRSDFNSGWGIRTLARGEARYNPMSYHNGSVWPHDNAIIAAGLARYGHKSAIVPIFNGLCKAAGWMDQRRLPELFCGFNVKRGRGPTLYPVACAPQAWASGSLFMVIQAMLGLEFVPDSHEIRLCNPILPPGIDEITIRDLKLREANVDFSVRRDGSAVSLRVIRAEGPVRLTLVLHSANDVLEHTHDNSQ